MMPTDSGAWLAATAHVDSNPSAKKSARIYGTTARTQRRWSTPIDAKGSPLQRYEEYVRRNPKPWRLKAMRKSLEFYPVLCGWRTEKLVEQYRASIARSLDIEATDAKAQFDPRVDWLEMAAGAERAAAELEFQAACRRIFAERKIPKTEVFFS